MRCENCGLEEITMILTVPASTIFWCQRCGSLFTKAPNWSYWRTPTGVKDVSDRGTREGLPSSTK